MSCPPCPRCQSEFVYQDQRLFICPECAHEWNPEEAAAEEAVNVADAHGTPLAEGDKVTLIKDLKVKGSSQVLKIGTKAVIKTAKRGQRPPARLQSRRRRRHDGDRAICEEGVSRAIVRLGVS